MLLSHTNLLANSYTIIEQYGVTGEDRMLTTIPLTHVGGQERLRRLGPLWVGAATTIVSPDIGLINFWSLVESLKVTCRSVVMAAFLSGLLRRRGSVNTGRLKGLLSGGSAVSAKLINDFHGRFGVPVYQVYGQTEMSSIVVSERPGGSHAGRRQHRQAVARRASPRRHRQRQRRRRRSARGNLKRAGQLASWVMSIVKKRPARRWSAMT